MRSEPATLMAAASPRLSLATVMVTTMLTSAMALMASSEATMRATRECCSSFIESRPSGGVARGERGLGPMSGNAGSLLHPRG